MPTFTVGCGDRDGYDRELAKTRIVCGTPTHVLAAYGQ